MRRCALRICVFLLLGAIANVAVAWGLTLAQPRDRSIRLLLEDFNYPEERRWSGTAEKGMFAGGYEYLVNEGNRVHRKNVGCGVDYLQRCGAFNGRRVFDVVPPIETCVQYGWPLRGCSTAWMDRQLGSAEVRLQQIPCIPIFRGFAINAVFYAVILWMLFAAPFVLRRRLRIKRGRCPKCAYPVGASDLCTECGTAVKPKAASA